MSSRRLPVYLVLDCSDSMSGDPIEAINQGIKALVAELQSEPYAIQTVYLSVITFGMSTQQVCPLTELMAFQPPLLSAGGTRALGGALKLLVQCFDKEIKKASDTQKGDWKPLVFIMADGIPTDTWEKASDELKKRKLANIIAVVSDSEAYNFMLNNITANVFKLDELQPDTLKQFFKWISQSIKQTSQSMAQVMADNQPVNLPPYLTESQLFLNTSRRKIMSSRRLPVYLVLDCSGSMFGDPIEAVNQGVKALVAELQSEPYAIETAYLSVITFESTAQQVCPLTELMAFQPPTLSAGGTTALGGALKLLTQCFEKEVKKASDSQKGDWKPLVFLMTDGMPTDTWEKAADELKKKKPANIIACAAGSGADEYTLKKLTEIVVKLDNLQPDTLKQFFKWVSQSIKQTSQSVAQVMADNQPINLPPPPKGIQIIP